MSTGNLGVGGGAEAPFTAKTSPLFGENAFFFQAGPISGPISFPILGRRPKTYCLFSSRPSDSDSLQEQAAEKSHLMGLNRSAASASHCMFASLRAAN